MEQRQTNPNIDVLREKANDLPMLPGVYFMYNSEDEIIYIGKAKKLKNRVSSYFHGDHLPKVEAMIEKIERFDVIIVKSEFEALLLENKMIKQYMPHYNILLKDDKGYPFLAIDLKKEYPAFEIVGKPSETDKRTFYGPYGSRHVTFEIIDAINKSLKLPTCDKKFPRDINKDRPCINFRLGLCEGWCRGVPGRDEYRKRITRCLYILDGRSAELKKEIEAEMFSAAEALEFEKAASLRDMLSAINGLGEKNHLMTDDYSVENERYVYKGDHYSEHIMKLLNTEKEIHRIEAFDISNLGKTGIVACMTVFQNGKPLKRDYRRFRIEGLSDQNDYESMYQAVYRRFKRYKDGDRRFSELPDLLLIDGGSNHCAKAEEALAELEIKGVLCLGMVKDSRHRTRALIDSSGAEIGIKGNQSLFSFFGSIQEETHRAAITYQQKVREENLSTLLENVPGIGPKRAEKLYNRYKSINGLKKADIDELKTVIPAPAAEALLNYLNNKEY